MTVVPVTNGALAPMMTRWRSALGRVLAKRNPPKRT